MLPAFSGNRPDALSDWLKLETGPLPRLAVASGFIFSFGGLRLLTPLCPILFSLRDDLLRNFFADRGDGRVVGFLLHASNVLAHPLRLSFGFR